jgi:ABC-type transport system involved in cytochrome c biogenesis permease component
MFKMKKIVIFWSIILILSLSSIVFGVIQALDKAIIGGCVMGFCSIGACVGSLIKYKRPESVIVSHLKIPILIGFLTFVVASIINIVIGFNWFNELYAVIASTVVLILLAIIPIVKNSIK